MTIFLDRLTWCVLCNLYRFSWLIIALVLESLVIKRYIITSFKVLTVVLLNFQVSIMWHCVTGRVVLDAVVDCIAFTFRSKKCKKTVNMIPWNVDDCSPHDTVLHSKMSVTAHQLTLCCIPKCRWLLTNWHCVTFQNVGDCSPNNTVSHSKMLLTANQMTRCHIPKCQWLLTNWHCVTFRNVCDCSPNDTVSHSKLLVTAHQLTVSHSKMSDDTVSHSKNQQSSSKQHKQLATAVLFLISIHCWC